MSKDGLGYHLIADLKGCSLSKIESLEFVQNTLKSAVSVGGATFIKDFAHQFSPYGISAVVIIAESHITFHSWPEFRAVAIDLFTCSSEMKPDLMINFLKEAFEATSIETQHLSRLQNLKFGAPKI